MYSVLSLVLREQYYSSRLSFIIAGQSNASGRGRTTAVGNTPAAPHPNVWLFGNDYVWKMAYEPIDDPAGQVDAVSDDSANIAAGYGHGFALVAATGLVSGMRRIDIVPCAMGGVNISDWLPGVDRLDRATLYGSANYRRSVACPDGDPTAILYFGHENQAGDPTYAAQWAELVTEFRTDFGAAVPFVFAQLAKHTTEEQNHLQHETGEVMRLFETGSGDATEMTGMYMVPTFDLALIDQIHLNEVGQKTLGARFALAIRQHILSDAVDGTGPRLATISAPAANQVKVDTTQTLATISGDADDQFRVFDDGEEMTITSVVQDPADDSAVLITMDGNASGTVTVSYGDVVASGAGVTLSNVVKNAAGLPLPQFGLQTVT